MFDPHERLGNGLVDTTYHFHPSFAGHAGALVSTTADMTRLVAALGDGRLLAPAALAALQDYRTCDVSGREITYGVGLFRISTVLGPAFGHGGLTFGYRTQTFHEPTHRVSFSIMTNFYPDQIQVITDEMLTTVTRGPRGPVAAACAVPAGFFDESDGTLRLRFRGRPGEAGIGHVTWQEHSLVTPLYDGRVVARGTADGGWVIEATTGAHGPRTRVRLEAGRATVAALAAGGVVTFAPEDSHAPRLFVEELVTDASGETDACVRAVAEPLNGDGRLAMCGGEDGVLRVFAQIRVSGLEADVDGALVAARRERCQRIEEPSAALHVVR